MLTGRLDRLESTLRRAFSESEYVEVAHDVAVTHEELLGRLACDFSEQAFQAVYGLFGATAPAPKEPESDPEGVTLGDLIEDRLDAVTGEVPGLIGS